MAKAKENLKIEVTQSTADDLRIITVTIAGPDKEFLLPDLLSQRGAIQAYDETLRQAVREATEGYLRGAEELIAGIAAGQKEPKAEVAAPKPKTNGHEKNTSKRDAKSSEKPEKPTSKPINETGTTTIGTPANAPMVVSASGD
jgi:hypothetical protein